MPRSPKAAAATAEVAAVETAPKKRGRPARTKVAADVVITEAEKALVAKYTKHKIVPGSWRAAGGRPDHGMKCTVEIICPCEAKRVLATSDLFHCFHCVDCGKVAKKNRRDKKKEAAK